MKYDEMNNQSGVEAWKASTTICNNKRNIPTLQLSAPPTPPLAVHIVGWGGGRTPFRHAVNYAVCHAVDGAIDDTVWVSFDALACQTYGGLVVWRQQCAMQVHLLLRPSAGDPVVHPVAPAADVDHADGRQGVEGPVEGPLIHVSMTGPAVEQIMVRPFY